MFLFGYPIGETIPIGKEVVFLDTPHSFTGCFSEDDSAFSKAIGLEDSFDLLRRPMRLAGKESALYFVDGFAKDDIMEKVMEFFLSLTEEQITVTQNAEAFCALFLPYIETGIETDITKAVTAVLSGQLFLLIDGLKEGILIDARTYPSRTPEEPEGDKVLRGARDGFVETIVFNTSLIRRRLRTPKLVMEMHQVGKQSKTDVVLCYIKERADPKLVKTIQRRLDSLEVDALTMGQESLAECILERQRFNPLPRMRYTERPDSTSAALSEGRIVLLVDNSPAAMILPTCLFDFTQQANDFYFPPFVGTYLKLVRLFASLVTLFLTPVWLLLTQHPQWVPEFLSFLFVKETNQVPIPLQLILVEVVLDAVKLAAMNTPNVLSNAFSIVGALILGDFAIQAQWFVPEVVLYMAFVAITDYSQPSFELGYAFKLFRMFQVLMIAFFSQWGFFIALAILFLLALFTRTVGQQSYLRPLVPFRKGSFLGLFFRRGIHKRNR